MCFNWLDIPSHASKWMAQMATNGPTNGPSKITRAVLSSEFTDAEEKTQQKKTAYLPSGKPT